VIEKIKKIQIEDYTLDKILGRGGFGEIYSAKSMTNSEEVAIKLEPLQSNSNLLLDEALRYKYLQGGTGIPKMYRYGNKDSHNFLVMELLGKSLEDLLQLCGGKFNLKTAALLWQQTITRMEYIHNKEFIHRDIKPDNFIMGKGKNKKTLYIIDFGLSKRFRDAKTGKHIPFKDGKEMVGTVRFASLNTHSGYELSRRDDLESLAYVIIYLLKGVLPWQGIPSKNFKEKCEKVFEMKKTLSVSELCKDLPYELESFLSYTRDLKFDQCPDYSYLKSLVSKMVSKEKIKLDNKYIWENEKEINKVQDLK